MSTEKKTSLLLLTTFEIVKITIRSLELLL